MSVKDSYRRGYEGEGYVRSWVDDAFGSLTPSDEEVDAYHQGQIDREHDKLRKKHEDD